MDRGTKVIAGTVLAASIGGTLLQEKYRRDHPVPTPDEWSAMWAAASERERAIMRRWSDRWLYPRGDERKAMDALHWRAVREPRLAAEIAKRERALGMRA